MEYTAWMNMRRRCDNPAHRAYPWYGGRGIKVCVKWQSFASFLADMGPRPTPQHTVDRINGEGDYTPDNCRWATWSEQGENRAWNHWLVYNGETITLSELARRIDLPYKTVHARMEAGWTLDMIVNTPLQNTGKKRR